MTPKIENTTQLLEQIALTTQSIRSSTYDLDIHENLTTTQRWLDNLSLSQDTTDITTQELQDRLAQVKAEADALRDDSKESRIAALVQEKQQLDHNVQTALTETKEIEDEIRQLHKELYELEHHDDEIELDEINLRLQLYRDLGIRLVPKDGKFTTVFLTNDTTHKVATVDMSKGYSPYYLAKIIWQQIT